MMWMARKAGLTVDDLCTMTFAQVDSWLELTEWVNSTGDDAGGETAQSGENRFFHNG